MKTTLAAAMAAALLLSNAVMAQEHEHPPGDEHRQENAVMHERGAKEGWYKKGGAVPREYRDDRYVVTDWRTEHLREPPRGYHWVRSDNGEFLLVAVTTGVIADIMLNH